MEPMDPKLKEFVLDDFIAVAPNGDVNDGPEVCGDLLRGIGAYHDYHCKTIAGRCLCQSDSHEGVWASPTVSLIGAQKGGSTAMLAYLMQHDHYRNAIAKEVHFFDRPESMTQRGVPGFFDNFDPADPDKFLQEQVGWTTPALLYALTAPADMKKVTATPCLVVCTAHLAARDT